MAQKEKWKRLNRAHWRTPLLQELERSHEDLKEEKREIRRVELEKPREKWFAVSKPGKNLKTWWINKQTQPA